MNDNSRRAENEQTRIDIPIHVEEELQGMGREIFESLRRIDSSIITRAKDTIKVVDVDAEVAYTDGERVYISKKLLNPETFFNEGMKELIRFIIWHEAAHILHRDVHLGSVVWSEINRLNNRDVTSEGGEIRKLLKKWEEWGSHPKVINIIMDIEINSSIILRNIGQFLEDEKYLLPREVKSFDDKVDEIKTLLARIYNEEKEGMGVFTMADGILMIIGKHLSEEEKEEVRRDYDAATTISQLNRSDTMGEFGYEFIKALYKVIKDKNLEERARQSLEELLRSIPDSDIIPVVSSPLDPFTPEVDLPGGGGEGEEREEGEESSERGRSRLPVGPDVGVPIEIPISPGSGIGESGIFDLPAARGSLNLERAKYNVDQSIYDRISEFINNVMGTSSEELYEVTDEIYRIVKMQDIYRRRGIYDVKPAEVISKKPIEQMGDDYSLNINVIVDDSGSMSGMEEAIGKFVVDLFNAKDDILKGKGNKLSMKINFFRVTTGTEPSYSEYDITDPEVMEEKVKEALGRGGNTEFDEAVKSIFSERMDCESSKNKELFIFLTDTGNAGGMDFLIDMADYFILAVTATTMEEALSSIEALPRELKDISVFFIAES